MANQQVGVFWQRQSQERGTAYLSGVVSLGVLGQCQVVCFRNTRDSKSENAPDWIMYLSEARQQSGTADNGAHAPITDDKEDLPF
jgi:hypothetical protein